MFMNKKCTWLCQIQLFCFVAIGFGSESIEPTLWIDKLKWIKILLSVRSREQGPPVQQIWVIPLKCLDALYSVLESIVGREIGFSFCYTMYFFHVWLTENVLGLWFCKICEVYWGIWSYCLNILKNFLNF